MPVTRENLGTGLQALGAGLQGRGVEFQQLQAQQGRERQSQADKLSQERQQAFAIDTRILRDHLENGRIPQGKELLMNRLQTLKQIDPNADDRDTAQALQLIDQDPEMLGELVKELDMRFTLQGLVPEYKQGESKKILTASQVSERGQYYEAGDDGVVARKVEGFEGSSLEDQRLKVRELELKEAQEERQRTKMSAGAEAALMKAQDAVVEAQRNSNEYQVLAKDFERKDVEGGLKSTVTETFKSILGSQDEVTEFRRRFNKVRMSEALKYLPPGPATDRDVQEAFRGVPPENAPASQVASFLRGAARLARFDAAYNQFKADYISSRRKPAGLNRQWRKSIESKKLGRKITVGEIYETAQNRGLAPEDVAAQLGVKLP